jgi:Protein of unknown function (DUF1479)
LQDDVADDDLCGAANGHSLPIDEPYHADLLPAMSPIPDVEPGDTVWWHADGVHAVEPVAEQKGLGQRHVHPGRPYCPPNAAYAEACGRPSSRARAQRTSHRALRDRLGRAPSRRGPQPPPAAASSGSTADRTRYTCAARRWGDVAAATMRSAQASGGILVLSRTRS